MIKRTKILFIILFMLSITIVLSYGFSYAKYASNVAWNYYLESKNFYFNSNVLSKNNVDNKWDGGKVYFDIKNSINSILASDYDIEYKITCITSDSNQKCNLNNTNSNTYVGTLSSIEGCIDLGNNTDVKNLDKESCINSGYEYRSLETTKDMYFTVENIDNTEVEYSNITILAESMSPYKKKIASRFDLVRDIEENTDIIKNYDEYPEYSRLVLTNDSSIDRCYSVNYPHDKLTLNQSSSLNLLDYNLDNNGYITSFKIKIKANSLENLIFYRLSLDNKFTINDFVISEIGC